MFARAQVNANISRARTSHSYTVVKTRWVWIRLGREHKSLKTSFYEVNHEISSSRIKVGIQYSSMYMVLYRVKNHIRIGLHLS